MQPVYVNQDDTAIVEQPLGSVQTYSQPPEGMPEQQENEYFQRSNDLRVIQEYNNEQLVPNSVKGHYWGLLSKSIKLGFWEKEDEAILFYYKNAIKIGRIMEIPKHKYTFAERQNMNMIDLVNYADFKRGVGMEKYRINERTLQATSITQSLSGNSNAGGRKGGVMGMLRGFFS